MAQQKPEQQTNPKFIKESMTIVSAAREAAMRNYVLKASWTPTMGLRVIAVPREV